MKVWIHVTLAGIAAGAAVSAALKAGRTRRNVDDAIISSIERLEEKVAEQEGRLAVLDINNKTGEKHE